MEEQSTVDLQKKVINFRIRLIKKPLYEICKLVINLQQLLQVFFTKNISNNMIIIRIKIRI